MHDMPRGVHESLLPVTTDNNFLSTEAYSHLGRTGFAPNDGSLPTNGLDANMNSRFMPKKSDVLNAPSSFFTSPLEPRGPLIDDTTPIMTATRMDSRIAEKQIVNSNSQQWTNTSLTNATGRVSDCYLT